ncbi:MAG: helix-turn-helix transcriptional regulator [Bacteroidales bacterium]|nr:helix-turn-helix transcriptional regulator [Bacteroidales bacterium]
MIERLKLFMDSYNLSAADLADEIDVQRSGISHLLSGRNNPSLSFITKLLEQYPELSPDWLLFDNGAMIREERIGQKKLEKKPISRDLFQEIEEEEEKEKDPIDFEPIDNETVRGSSIEEKPSVIRSEPEIPYGLSKDVEKIVIFYRDRTFIEYKSR